jgi:hypothetical protein
VLTVFSLKPLAYDFRSSVRWYGSALRYSDRSIFIEEDLHRLGHSFESVTGQQLDGGVEFVRLNLVGQVRFPF